MLRYVFAIAVVAAVSDYQGEAEQPQEVTKTIEIVTSEEPVSYGIASPVLHPGAL